MSFHVLRRAVDALDFARTLQQPQGVDRLASRSISWLISEMCVGPCVQWAVSTAPSGSAAVCTPANRLKFSPVDGRLNMLCSKAPCGGVVQSTSPVMLSCLDCFWLVKRAGICFCGPFEPPGLRPGAGVASAGTLAAGVLSAAAMRWTASFMRLVCSRAGCGCDPPALSPGTPSVLRRQALATLRLTTVCLCNCNSFKAGAQEQRKGLQQATCYMPGTRHTPCWYTVAVQTAMVKLAGCCSACAFQPRSGSWSCGNQSHPGTCDPHTLTKQAETYITTHQAQIQPH